MSFGQVVAIFVTFLGGFLIGTNMGPSETMNPPGGAAVPAIHIQNVFKGPLKTTQGVILDERDNFVFLKIFNDTNLLYGANQLEPLHTCDQYYRTVSEAEADKVAAEGFTAVRMEINWNSMNAYPNYESNNLASPYLKAIHDSIDTYGHHGLGVFLTLGERGWSSQESTRGCSGLGIPKVAYLGHQSQQETVCAILSEPARSGMLQSAWKVLASSMTIQKGILGAELMTGNDVESCNANLAARMEVTRIWDNTLGATYPTWVQLWPSDAFSLLNVQDQGNMKVAVETISLDWGYDLQGWENHLKTSKEVLPLILDSSGIKKGVDKDSLIEFSRGHGLGVIP